MDFDSLLLDVLSLPDFTNKPGPGVLGPELSYLPLQNPVVFLAPHKAAPRTLYLNCCDDSTLGLAQLYPVVHSRWFVF